MFRIVTFCLLMCAVADVSGQWGTARCSPVGDPVVNGWYEAGPGLAELWWSGERVGVLNVDDCTWTTNGKTVSADMRVFGSIKKAAGKCCCNGKCGPCKCADCPVGCGVDCGCDGCKKGIRVVGDVIENHGIDLDRMRKCDGKECYRVNGRETTRQAAFESIQAGSVPDDSGKRRVVVVGSDAAQRQVAADWGKGELSAYRDTSILHCYAPDHWHVKDVGYKAYADPSIYIVDAGGKVLHRQDYYDGPVKLAGALRKTDPSYDPSKDPDVNKSKPDDKPAPTVPSNQWQAYIAAALLAVVGFFLGKKG